MNELISVVVPIYQVEDYLDRCVSSIVKQTYSQLEIILVDDGSSDSCPTKCDAWAVKDERITVIHKANGGLASARNAGLDVSAGAYVCFVDSDDYLPSSSIEVMHRELLCHDADVVMGYSQPVNEDGHLVEMPVPEEEIVDGQTALNRFLYHRQFTGPVWGKLYRMSFFQGTDPIRFPEGLNSEDYYALAKFYSRMTKMYIHGDLVYYYCRRLDSICTTKQIGPHTFDKLSIAEKTVAYLKSVGYADIQSLNYFLMQGAYDVLYSLLRLGADRSVISQYRRILSRLAAPVYKDPNVSRIRKMKLMAMSVAPIVYYKLTRRGEK